MQHAGQVHVDPVDRIAQDLVDDLEPPLRRSDQLPFGGVLELDIVGRLDAGGRLGNLTERQAAPARNVSDDAPRRPAFGGRDVPPRGGGADEHFARGRAGPAQKVLRGANRAAAAGGHVSPGTISLEVFRRRGELGLDLAPIAFELFWTSIGSAVKPPWPISDLATRMITVSSGSITIQAVISLAGVAAAGEEGPNGMSKPSSSEPPPAATLASKARRSMGAAGFIGGAHAPAAA